MRAEDKYKQQLQELGTWRAAFDPEIHTLCMMERELRRAQKEWREARLRMEAQEMEPGEYARALRAADGHYTLILQLRRDILAHRDALGLTPKGLRRLRTDSSAMETGGAAGMRQAETVFGALMEKVREYD